ncbi:MAG TPA: hypothetical protein VFX43_08110, partial [Chitinophagaceae bacterium]|nr:hypothetical protein [Chitinophagaceae bacterium]
EEYVRIPEVLDPDWCLLFNEAYSHARMNTVIDTDFILFPISTSRKKRMSFRNLDLESLGTGEHAVEGQVKRVELIRRIDDLIEDDEEAPFTAFIVLTHADLITYPEPITIDENTQVWVPLKGLENITLYPSHI